MAVSFKPDNAFVEKIRVDKLELSVELGKSLGIERAIEAPVILSKEEAIYLIRELRSGLVEVANLSDEEVVEQSKPLIKT